MDFEKFSNFADQYNIVPVYKEMTGDLLTPVLAFLRLRKKGKNHILLESVEGIGRLARYSFISKDPIKTIANTKNQLHIKFGEKEENRDESIFDYLQNEIKSFRKAPVDELPEFTGGIVGYLGYENVALIERSIDFSNSDKLDIPDSSFGVYDKIIAFDHFKHRLILIKNVFINNEQSLKEQYNSAVAELNDLEEEIKSPEEILDSFECEIEPDALSTENFSEIIDNCKRNIYEGDVFQIVYSNRFSGKFTGDFFNVYRALRIVNPSPYMYFLGLENGLSIAGTSPEDLLKVNGSKATILPIAGTRKRGKTDAEDEVLEKELLADPKEIAEHTMLVDLARNDLGRVCDFESIAVTENKKINRFSHVMHIVSRVEGELQNDKDCIDALKASFPAGTVTGAPKIRAIQLLNDYEQIKRGIYAGAVGYIDFNGNLDMCIAIRTLFAKENKVYWQAGAGIVADSKAEQEDLEIHNKSAALVRALEYAGEIE